MEPNISVKKLIPYHNSFARENSKVRRWTAERTVWSRFHFCGHDFSRKLSTLTFIFPFLKSNFTPGHVLKICSLHIHEDSDMVLLYWVFLELQYGSLIRRSNYEGNLSKFWAQRILLQITLGCFQRSLGVYGSPRSSFGFLKAIYRNIEPNDYYSR